MKIITIVGARPQFIKAAMVSRAILSRNKMGSGLAIDEQIIHTGQHFDHNMSEIFFDQMHIPIPVANLDINGGTHGEMTGRMLAAIEAQFITRNPDMVIVYGDTNSTLAGALAAAKLNVPVAHVEAGLRSFNRRMPEEINRLITDHVASLLLCPTNAAVSNLAAEGISEGVRHVGDVLFDAAQTFGKIAESKSTILDDLGITAGEYLLVTVHRAENTDDPFRLRRLIESFEQLSKDTSVVFLIHPRTRIK